MADTSNSVLFDAPGPKGRRTIRIVNWIAGILFAVVLVLILMRLHNPPDGENQLSWELWKPAIEREAWTDFYLPGLWMTIKATVVAVVGAVVFGLVARLFTLCIRTVKRLYARLFTNYLAAAATGGIVIAVLFLCLGMAPYAGLSEWMVGAAFRGETTLVDPVAKLGMTALTVGAGLQGGEVTPLFGIGASLGGWIGQVTMGDPSLVAALGMVGVFGAALNVPITTIMLGIDMFGAQAAGYFVIVGFVSYLVAGHAAVYPAQRIVTPKRRGLKDDAALTVEGALERHRRELEELMDE